MKATDKQVSLLLYFCINQWQFKWFISLTRLSRLYLKKLIEISGLRESEIE
jgi:hypothetical protein